MGCAYAAISSIKELDVDSTETPVSSAATSTTGIKGVTTEHATAAVPNTAAFFLKLR